MQPMQPIPPLYCAETQERIWPEDFGLRKAVWCNGKPYLVDVARRLRLMPDPMPPKGFEALQFGKPLPGFVPPGPKPAASRAGPAAGFEGGRDARPTGARANLPPAAAFKPADILAAVKSGVPMGSGMGSPAVVPITPATPIDATPVPPSILASGPKVQEGTVITTSPLSAGIEASTPATAPESADRNILPPTSLSRPPDMDTKQFKQLEAAALALEEAIRHKKEIKHELGGPTPPPGTVSPAAISTLRAPIVPARMPDKPDPASHVVVVQPPSEPPKVAADSVVISLGEHRIGQRSDTVTAVNLPPAGSTPKQPSVPDVPPPAPGAEASAAAAAEDVDAAPEGTTRMILLRNLRAQQTPPQKAENSAAAE